MYDNGAIVGALTAAVLVAFALLQNLGYLPSKKFMFWFTVIPVLLGAVIGSVVVNVFEWPWWSASLAVMVVAFAFAFRDSLWLLFMLAAAAAVTGCVLSGYNPLGLVS